MPDSTSRVWEIFLEVFESLPRQGPGNRECAAEALAFCRELPIAPAVLDMGCGVGGQTLQVAELTLGTIVAVDKSARCIAQLRQTVAGRGLATRIRPIVGDMTKLELPSASFDLIWSEGAFYIIGIENALRICHALLRPRGYLVFTDCVWKNDNPPPELKALFDQEYPTMGRARDVAATLENSGYEVLAHFTLPDESWWTEFYTPLEARLRELRVKYAVDNEALAILDQLAAEPEMFRQHSQDYGYEFFSARRIS